MEFLKKKDIFKLASNINDIDSAMNIVNIHNQRVRFIDVHADGIKYAITGFFFGYEIEVGKTGSTFETKETLYKNSFDIFTLLKIKKIVKKYKKVERLKKLKEIKAI